MASTETDLLVLPWFEGEGADALGRLDGLDRATAGQIARSLASREFTGRACELFLAAATSGAWRAARVALIGAGQRAAYGPVVARRVAVIAGITARQRRVARAVLACRLDGITDAVTAGAVVQATAEGLTLAEFNGGIYKTCDPAPAPPAAWTVVTEGGEAVLADAAARGQVLGDSSNRARDLTNEPGNVLTPSAFASRVAAIAAEGGIRCDILDGPQIESLGMGLLLGVARGSVEPPRVVVLRYDPPGVSSGPVLGLVGKGITFDTGGISIKPADGMERMKDDMAGGAAVAGAMRAVGLLGAPIRVVGVIPMAENMPGGRAIKPGDVLKSAEGKTVEVINTDAEGRLVLGDGLWYARRLGATHLIDIATLTGAVVVALGKITSGLFGSSEPWLAHIKRVGDVTGDQMWPMPLFDEYRDQLKSEIADMTNTGGRPAGSITAAMFLKEFTGGLPWAHLDIAGTAWAEEAKPYQPKGPSGVAVRTLAEVACGAASWAGRI